MNFVWSLVELAWIIQQDDHPIATFTVWNSNKPVMTCCGWDHMPDRREEPCERQREQQLQSLAAKEGIQVSLNRTGCWMLLVDDGRLEF